MIAFSLPGYRKICNELANRLPWFGEKPFEASKKGYIPRPSSSDIGFVRRVLVSWLIGRPVSQVAKRADCSSRQVLNLLHEVIYLEEEYLEEAFYQWLDLGLIAPVNGPEFRGDPDSIGPWRDIDPDHLPVFCVVCH